MVHVRAETLDQEARTVEVIWAEGAKVKRYDWYEGGYYIEELSMDPAHIRLDRFASGMSLLDSHSPYSMDDRLGTVVPGSVRIEGGKAYATVKLSRKARAEELFQDLVDGHSFPVSVGYRTHAYEKTEGDGETLPILRAIDWEPQEISAVPIPADPGAHSLRQEGDEKFIDVAVSRRTAKEKAMPQGNKTGRRPLAEGNPTGQRGADGEGEDDEDDGDDTVAGGDDTVAGGDDGNDDGDTVTGGEGGQRQQQRAPAARQQPAPVVPPAADPDASTRAMREAAERAVADERKRNQDIDAIAVRTGMDEGVTSQAKRSGMSVETFRDAAYEALIKRQNETGIFPHSARFTGQDEVQTRREAAANAILHRHGVVRELTDAARASGFRDMSSMDIAKELMRERGESTRGSVNEIATRAFHTTSDFPAILADVTNQTVLAGYATYENTFQLIASRNVVSDFRDVKLLEIGDTPDLLKVNEHGEFKRGTMKEGTEAFKIDTYGRIIGFTRQMLINDRLNAFVTAAQEQGRKVAKLEGDVVWGVIKANANLSDGNPIFSAAHGNVAAAGTYLTLDALKAARTAYRKLKSLDGEPINIPPKYLFVGTELEINAQVILAGVPNGQTLAVVVPEAIKSITPVYEYRLDGLGDYAWMLFADPAVTGGRGVQYAYLSGQEQPFYESRVGFDVDGIEYKVRHDFGAGVTDYRFGYKNPGAAPTP